MPRITPFRWYNGQVKEAVDLYTSVFPDSKVINTSPGPGGALMSATVEMKEGDAACPLATVRYLRHWYGDGRLADTHHRAARHAAISGHSLR